MYSGVPAPLVERVEDAESQIRATPKSATRGAAGVTSSSIRILAGLISRCTRLAAWTALSPAAMAAP